MKRALGASVLAFAFSVASANGAPIPITKCGGTIPANQKAVLQNDIVCEYRCSGDPSIVCGYNGECGRRKGVCEPEEFVLEHGATLDLNGHNIDSAYQSAAAVCGPNATGQSGRCTVKGPGTIVGNKGTAIASPSGTDIVARNVTISYSDGAIYTAGRVMADGLVILPDRENSVYGAKGITLKNVHANGESGIFSDGDITVDNVTIGRHGIGVAATGKVRGHDVEIEGYGGVSGRDVVLRRVSSKADPYGDTASFISALRQLRLVDSDVVTIKSGKEPVLVRSTCEQSETVPAGGSWGVCTDD